MGAVAVAAGKVTVTSLDTLRERRERHNIAQATREQAWAAATAAEATLAESTAASRSTGTKVTLVVARVEMQEADRLHSIALLAALRADEAEAEARVALKEALRIEILNRKRVAVTKLARALIAARPAADELAAVEDDEAAWLGQVPDRLGWPVLTTGTPGFEPHLDHWRKTCRAYGLLDDIG